MARIEDVRRYMDVMTYYEGHEHRFKWTLPQPFITISRQAGAGGRALAKHLIQEMNKEPEPLFHAWHLFDKELCADLTQGLKADPTIRFLEVEHYASQTEEFVLSLLAERVSQDKLVKDMFDLIRRYARGGKVILVGRGSGLVTRGMPGAIRVRLIAPEPLRIERMMRLMKMDYRSARNYIRTQDHDRAGLIRHFHGENIEQADLYDCVWNTATVNLETITRALIAAVKVRSDELKAAESRSPVSRFSSYH